MSNLIQPKIDPLMVTHQEVFLLSSPVGKTQALARVVLNHQLQLTGLRVVAGVHGMFVAYPNDPSYKGDDYRSIYYPITKELREHIEQVVIALYNEKMLTNTPTQTGESA